MNRTRKELRNDRFPLLEVPELSICLKSCNLNAPEEDLIRPSPIFIQSLFQQILEIFLLIPVSTFRSVPGGVGVGSENGDEDDDDVDYEALNLIKLQKCLYKFFVDCGVYDFVLVDLIKPDAQRIKRLLSAIVNFARFREEHLYDNEEILKNNNLKFEEFNKLQREFEKNNSKNIELNEVLVKFNDKYKKINELNSYNLKMEKELKQLKKIQESLTLEHLNYKNEKLRLIQILEDHNYLLLDAKKNLDKWKSYLIESPEILNKILKDLNNSLQIDENLLNQLELKSRNLSITINSIQMIDQNFKIFLNLINEIKIEINQQKSSSLKLNKFKEEINGANFQIGEFERKIQLLTRQINHSQEKYDRILNSQKIKKEEFDKKINELNDQYLKLVNEKNINENLAFTTKKAIEDTEKQINELKKAFEIEYNETNNEILKMNSHLNFYLNQIDKRLEI